MRCIDCPCYHYNGKGFYCEAYPWVDMNESDRGMFSSVHTNPEELCPGLVSHTQYLEDMLQQAILKYCEAADRVQCTRVAVHAAVFDKVKQHYLKELREAEKNAQGLYAEMRRFNSTLMKMKAVRENYTRRHV